MPDFSKQLSQYMPEAAAPIISAWINDTGCQFRISRSRSTKLGDYTAPFRGAPHKISVNYDLNPYAFLITTIHEFAHLQTWQQHKHQVKPHGIEWKNHYKQLMAPFLQLDIFPEDIRQAIGQYMENPAASSCTDVHLYRTLRMHDNKQAEQHLVESLPTNSIFALENGRIFQKGEKLRKRYQCLELSTDRTYLIHPIAEVILIKEAEGIKK